MSAFRAIILSFFYGLLLLSKLYIFSALTRFLGTKTLEVAGDLFGFLDLAVGCGIMMEFSVRVMGDIIWWYPLHPFGIPEGIYISVVDYLYQTWCDLSWCGSQRSSSIGAVMAVQNFTEKVHVNTIVMTSLGNVSDSSAPDTLSGTLWFFSDTLRGSPSSPNFTTPPLIPHLIHPSSIDNISSRRDLTRIRPETYLVWVLPMIIISSAVFMFYGAKSDTGSQGGSPCSKILDSLSNTNRKAGSLAGSSNGSDVPPVDTPTTLPLDCADLKLGTVLLFPFDLEIGTWNDSNHTAASDLSNYEDAELGTSSSSDIYLGARSEDVPPTLAAAFTRTIPSSGDLVGQDGTPENLVIISASSGILANSQTAACSCLSDLVLQYQVSTPLCDDPVVSEIIPRDDVADKLAIDPNPVASISDTSDTGDVNLTCQEDVIDGSNISLANLNTGGNSLSTGAVLLDGSEVSTLRTPYAAALLVWTLSLLLQRPSTSWTIWLSVHPTLDLNLLAISRTSGTT
ncbi:hypothetical protein BD779DRAFT_1671360 [Infundibulicybe gibba]|nr:hypothetical protein BD779DRAFT_1671360 [Infundibulicybe gibba]